MFSLALGQRFDLRRLGCGIWKSWLTVLGLLCCVPHNGLAFDAFAFVRAKGTGSVTVTVGSYSVVCQFSGATTDWLQPSSVSSSGSAIMSLTEGNIYLATVQSSGVVDYIVSFEQAATESGAKRRLLLDGKSVDSLQKSEITGGRFSVQAVLMDEGAFGTMDDSKYPIQRLMYWTLGSSATGQSGGLLIYHRGSHLSAGTPGMNFYPGPATLESIVSGTRIQARSGWGYIDVSGSGASWTIRFYKDRGPSAPYPKVSGLFDFGSTTPVTSYQLDYTNVADMVSHPQSGMSLAWRETVNISRTVGSDTRYREIQTSHFNARVLVSASYEGGYPNSWWTERYFNNTDSYVRAWPWRRVSAPRGALSETIVNSQYEEIRQSGPIGVSIRYLAPWVKEIRYDGSTAESTVLTKRSLHYRDTNAIKGGQSPSTLLVGDGSHERSVFTNGTDYIGDVYTSNATGGTTRTENFRLSSPVAPGNLTPGAVVGQPKTKWQSFGDGGTSDANALVTSYLYTTVAGVWHYPSSVVTRQGSVEIGREAITYSVGTFQGQETITTTRTTHVGPGQTTWATATRYSPRTSDQLLRGRAVSERRPDGVKISYAYQRGTFWDGAWYPYPQSPPTASLPAGAHVLVAVIAGKAGTSVSTYTPMGSSSIPVDPLDLEAMTSTAEEKILDSQGNTLCSSTSVYTGFGYTRVKSMMHRYDELGRLVLSADTLPVTPGVRVHYEASYRDSAGDLTWVKQWERDATGALMRFESDDYGRVSRVTRSAIGSSGTSDYIPEQVTTFTYDGMGRIKSKTLGSPVESETLVTTYEYDLVAKVDRVVAVTEPGGFKTTTSYDSRIQTTVTSLGCLPASQPQNATKVTTFWKDGRRKTTGGTAVPDVSYTYAYNSAGNLVTTESLASGAWKRTVTDWTGRKIREESPIWGPNGGVGGTREDRWEYSPNGQLIATSSWLGAALLMPKRLRQYDAFGRLFREGTDSNNNGLLEPSLDLDVVQYHFHYEQLQMHRFDSGGPLNATPEWYIYRTELIWPYSLDLEPGATDRSNEFAFRNQSYEQLSGLKPSLWSHEFGRDRLDNWTQSILEFDQANATVSRYQVVPGSNRRVATIERAGAKVRESNAQGHVTLFVYDGLGRLVGRSDPRFANSTSFDYKLGTALVETTTAPDTKKTEYRYDALGRVERETLPGNRIIHTLYDMAGNRTHVWGSATQPVHWEYNDSGQVTKMYTYRGGSWTSESLPGGFAVAVDRDCTVFQFHSATGLMEKRTDARGKSMSHEFDALGRITKRTDPRGWTTTYNYFGLGNSTLSAGQFQGNLKSVEYTDPAGTSATHFTYERRGRLRTVEDGMGIRTFNYYDSWTSGSPTELRDGSGLLQSETLPATLGGHVIMRDYSDQVVGRINGSPISVEINNSSTYRISYLYDDVQRVSQVRYMSDPAFVYGYLANSNLIDTVTQGGAGVYTYFRDLDYDLNADRIVRINHRSRPGTAGDANQIESYIGYNAIGLRAHEKVRGSNYGNLIARPIWGSHLDLEYNDRGELTRSGRHSMDGGWNPQALLAGSLRSYQYDPIGNRIADQAGLYQPTIDNRYSSTPYGAAPTYDDAGNMLSDGMGRNYEYDGENRLVKVASGSVSLSFSYDYLGRRTIRRASSGPEIRYLHDGWNVMAEMNQSGTITKRFAWGLDAVGSTSRAGGVGGLLVVDSGSGRYFPFYDGSFNVLGLFSSDGSIAAAYEYDTFGNLVARGGGYADSNRYRFSTKESEVEADVVLANGCVSSLSYYGRRFYHTAFGRFLSRDPIAERGGINLYGFCENNPMGRWDVLGMAPGDLYREPSISTAPAPKEEPEVIPDDLKEEARLDAARAAEDKLRSEIISRYGIATFVSGLQPEDCKQAARDAGEKAYRETITGESGKAEDAATTTPTAPTAPPTSDTGDGSQKRDKTVNREAANNTLSGSNPELPAGFTAVENGKKWKVPGAEGVYFQMIAEAPNGRGYAVKLVAPEGVSGTLVQFFQQKIAVSGGRVIDRSGYEGWRVQGGTMGIVVQERIGSMTIDRFVPQTDTFVVYFNPKGVGTAGVEGWAQFIPNKSPDDLRMVLGAGRFDGSGNGTYFSDSAPAGFSMEGARHRGVIFSRPTEEDTWQRKLF